MTRQNISEALGNISDRHIEEAAEYRVKKAIIPKWAALTAACLVLAVIIAAVALPKLGNGTPPPVIDTSSVTDDDTSTSESQDIPFNPIPTVYDFCKAKNGIFLKLELSKICEEVCGTGDDGNGPSWLLVEFNVLDIVYIGQKSNTEVHIGEKIVIPIYMYTSFSDGDGTSYQKLDTQKTKDWLKSFDCFYITTRFYSHSYLDVNDLSKEIETFYQFCAWQNYGILPVKDNKVVIDEVHAFLDGHIDGYKAVFSGHYRYSGYEGIERLIYNNIPCDEFEENYKIIAEENMSGNRVDYYPKREETTYIDGSLYYINW